MGKRHKLSKKQLRAMFAKQKMDLSHHSNQEILDSMLIRAKMGDESSAEFKQLDNELKRRNKK